jgi:lysophospholipase L1-like esterase
MALLILACSGVSAAVPGGPAAAAAIAPLRAGGPAAPVGADTLDAPPAGAPASAERAGDGSASASAQASGPPRPLVPVATVAPVRTTRTFVALGDSLTAWAWDPGTRCTSADTWPSVLATLDSDLVLLRNAGVPGNRSWQMAARFGRDVLAYHPDLLFVLGGANDIGDRRPALATVGYLRTIVRAARSQGIGVVLLTIPPNSRLHAPERRLLLQTNTEIVRMADEEGVMVVDLYSVLVNPSGGLAKGYAAADGLHLNHHGEAAVAQAVYAALHPVSPPEYWQR